MHLWTPLEAQKGRLAARPTALLYRKDGHLEMLEPVIDWHESDLLPLGTALTTGTRCKFLHGDFFALAASEEGFLPNAPGSGLHA